uniref:Uncharacterized protein n=1 Tax=Anopheles quadriannulatus TaxID=34691 RepID=A0A182XU06_ANOQN
MCFFCMSVLLFFAFFSLSLSKLSLVYKFRL